MDDARAAWQVQDVLLLLTTALALEPTTKVPVTFPGAGLDLGVEVVRCTATAEIDVDGTVHTSRTAITEACPEVFATAIDQAVNQWTYPASSAPTTTDIAFKWRLESTAWPTMTPAELSKVIGAHERVPLGVDGCELRIRIGTDGSIARLQSSAIPECLVMPLGPARNPKRLRREAEGNVLCTARFTSDRGVASDIDLSDCPEKWRLAADIALRNWQWQTGPDRYEAYTVRFVFLVQ